MTIEIKQVDRDRAAEFGRMIGRLTSRDADNMRAGEWDATKDVQWFATQRSTYEARIAELEAERDALIAERDRPETIDFLSGVSREASHQRTRWGADHDAGKTPFDWFWLIGYLAQKAADAAVRGDADKAKHHTISTAAALANWHLALTGADTSMRPGIDPARFTQETERGLS